MDTACFVPSPFYRCPRDWPAWKLTCWALIYAKQFLLSALAEFHPLNDGLDNTFNRKIKLFFWKLHFSDYLSTSLPPFPTYGSNFLSVISRAPILRHMWASFILVSALCGSQFCLLLFRDHTGVLSKLHSNNQVNTNWCLTEGSGIRGPGSWQLTVAVFPSLWILAALCSLPQ